MTNPSPGASPAAAVPSATASSIRRAGLALLTGAVLAGAVVALGAGGEPATATAPSGALKLVVEFDRDADARDDLAPAGDSAGDQVMYADPVFNAANTRKIGRAMFVNTFQESQSVLVAGALRLPDGTITLAGTMLSGKAQIAVTGGTGRYAGAQGTYTLGNKPVAAIVGDGPGRYKATIIFTD